LTGNPDWSSCPKGRRARTANRWAVGGATRRVAVRFKRLSGRRTRLSRDSGRPWEFFGALMTPRGPIGREQAGSPAVNRTGFLGVVLLKFGPSSPGAYARTGHLPTRYPTNNICRTGPRSSEVTLKSRAPTRGSLKPPVLAPAFASAFKACFAVQRRSPTPVTWAPPALPLAADRRVASR
jgi:hypothetical protein